MSAEGRLNWDYLWSLEAELAAARRVVQAVYDHCEGHETIRHEHHSAKEIRFIIEDQGALGGDHG